MSSNSRFVSTNSPEGKNTQSQKRSKKTRLTFDVNDFKPLRFGVCMEPLSIILKYLKPSVNERCHHRIDLRKFKKDKQFKVSDILDFIKKRHRDWLKPKYISDDT